MSIGHVYIVLEPIGSTHLRFNDARVIKEVCMWLPNVVRSPGRYPVRHEEFRNGPGVKIYIWEVLFWSPERFRTLSVLYRECRKGSEGPPAPGGHMGCRGCALAYMGQGHQPQEAHAPRDEGKEES